MPRSVQRDDIRRADAHEYQHFVAAAKRRVKIGQRIRIDGRKGKVVGVYEDYIVVEFTIFFVLWQVKYDKYRECFFWSEVAGLV